MEDPSQGQPGSEDQPAQENSLAVNERLSPGNGTPPGAKPPAKQPESKIQRILKFAAGFLGWFLVSFIVFGRKIDSNGLEISLGVVFFANIVILTFLLRKRSFFGWGMLSAIAVNLIVSLILGVFINALCFVPFYNKY